MKEPRYAGVSSLNSGLRNDLARFQVRHVGRSARRRGSHPASGAADEVEQGPQL